MWYLEAKIHRIKVKVNEHVVTSSITSDLRAKDEHIYAS